MSFEWEVESDKSRRTVSLVVNNFTMGYYYEDKSDPGVFPIYRFDPSIQDYIFFNVAGSEVEAKSLLRLAMVN